MTIEPLSILNSLSTEPCSSLSPMQLDLRRPTAEELISLHDLYALSNEPDAPRSVFADLTPDEKTAAHNLYEPDFHFSVYSGDFNIGFVGIYPDDDFIYVGLFYILKPEHRHQGYFAPLLRAVIKYAQENYPDYRFLKAFTRKENKPSVQGLLRCSFIHEGEEVQNVGQRIIYQKYLFPLRN